MKTEEILQAVLTNLTGLTTTGANVQREQGYDIEQAAMPALVISQGEDVAEMELMQSYVDWALDIDIDVLVRGDQENIVTLLNTIRNEIHTALYVDYKQGLDFVITTKAVTADRPDLSVEGNRPITRQRLTYRIKYRSAWTNFD